MLVVPGRYIGDAWFYVEGRTCHCFFLTAPDTVPIAERWLHWDIGHAVSDDLVHWRDLGLALERGPAGAWDSAKLATGSVIRHGGRYWMAYTGHRQGEHPVVQRVGMAVSDDLTTWRKLPENPVTQADSRRYERIGSGSRTVGHWRDPFLFRRGEFIYHAVCARARTGDVATRGTVGLARSLDLRRWEVLPPLAIEAVAEEMEVPQIYAIDGRYYLVFCTQPRWLSPGFQARYPQHRWQPSDYCMVSESLFGPYHMGGSGEIIPTRGEKAPPVGERPYASQLVRWKGKWFLMGTVVRTVRGTGDDYVCDPLPVRAEENGLVIR